GRAGQRAQRTEFHGSQRGSSRTRRLLSLCAQLSIVVMVVALAQGVAVPQRLTPKAAAATSCPADGCAVTIDARDFPTGDPLDSFNYIINLDNTKLPSDPLSLSTESNSPIMAEGGDSHPTSHLPAGR